jgi:hypothetical protein
MDLPRIFSQGVFHNIVVAGFGNSISEVYQAHIGEEGNGDVWGNFIGLSVNLPHFIT